MARNKLLLPVDGESLLRRAARRALAGGLEPVLVVLGHEAEKAHAELAGLAVRPIFNPAYAEGIQTSRRAGILALPAEIHAVVILLADMPFVTEAMIAELVRRHRESGAPLVISDYEGIQAPPMLYDRSLFQELAAAEGDDGARGVFRRHSRDAVTVSWPAKALADIDRLEDYERRPG